MNDAVPTLCTISDAVEFLTLLVLEERMLLTYRRLYCDTVRTYQMSFLLSSTDNWLFSRLILALFNDAFWIVR